MPNSPAKRPINTRPPGVNLKAAQKYLSAFDAPRAENRKLLSVIVVMAFAMLALAAAVMHMMPLHQRIPYFVTADPSSGAVTISNQVAQRFTPSDANKRYFLAKWVTDLLTIDDQTKDRLPDSYAMLRGAALSEWQAFEFNSYKPLTQLHDNPTMKVYPTILAIGFIGDDSAAIRVALHGTQGDTVKHLLVTVKFAILPPETDAEVYHNPIGLWITHFEVTDESTQQ